MTRLLSIALLAALLAGSVASGTQGVQASPAELTLTSQSGGGSGMRMYSGCAACPMPVACIATTPNNPFVSAPAWLQPLQPSHQHLDQIMAPDTAPPKPFSA